jgi:hypothetical protein
MSMEWVSELPKPVPKRPRGRPKKYATDEERIAAIQECKRHWEAKNRAYYRERYIRFKNEQASLQTKTTSEGVAQAT